MELSGYSIISRRSMYWNPLAFCLAPVLAVLTLIIFDFPWLIPLLLRISPHFACTCLFHCLNYVFSFVFRPSWLQNFVFETPWQSRLILNRTMSHSISVQLRNYIQFSFVSCSIHNSHKVRSLSVRSQPTFPPLSPKLSFHRASVNPVC